MHYTRFFDVHSGWHFGFVGGFIIALFVIWELAWKGYGLWRAARDNQPIWFVAILLLNTLGILPILYIYVFSSNKKAK